MNTQHPEREDSIARGAQGRVVTVHRATRKGLAQSGIFMLAAVIAAVAPHDTGVWLPIHLFVLGGLLTAICSTTQMLAVTWSSAPATPPWIATAQRWCLAAGTIAVCVGREADVVRLVDVGGAAVIVAVAAMIPILLRIRRGAVIDRFAPAIDAYMAAMAFGVAGTSLAIVVATGRASTHWWQLRDIHIIFNVFGLVGLVIAATLPYFTATQARRKMSARATPAGVRIVVGALAVATLVAALGQWSESTALASIGLVAYGVGLVAIVAMLPIYGRRQFSWAGPRLVQLLAGIGWWSASSIALAYWLGNTADERRALTALVVGGYAQILVSSLAYLGPVLRGGGHQQLTAGFSITRSWVSLAAGNIAAVGALADVSWLLRIGLLVWMVDIAIRAVRLVASTERAPLAA